MFKAANIANETLSAVITTLVLFDIVAVPTWCRRGCLMDKYDSKRAQLLLLLKNEAKQRTQTRIHYLHHHMCRLSISDQLPFSKESPLIY